MHRFLWLNCTNRGILGRIMTTVPPEYEFIVAACRVRNTPTLPHLIFLHLYVNEERFTDKAINGHMILNLNCHAIFCKS